MKFIENLKPWLGRKSVRGALFLLLVVVLILVFSARNNRTEELIEAKLPVVTITTPSEHLGSQSLSVIGTVRAFTEAVVTSERAGRVTGVNVSLAQQVPAGTVLATLENASEQAAVLQAEGVYDAALAAAAQSTIGVDEANTALLSAQNNAVSAFKASYNTVNGVVRNSIDTLFSDPDAKVPGLRIDGKGFTAGLNNERVAYQAILPTWQNKTNTISNSSDLKIELTYAVETTQRTIEFIDTFLTVFSLQTDSSRYSDSELQSLTSSFTSLRSTLIGIQSNLDGAMTGLNSAEDTVRRAELASSGSQNSAADAQVKQALGTLRAAQANLAKTILRTPVSGTVNSLSVRTGDFISTYAEVAIVANNSALEVVTFVSDTERDLIAVGDTVTINNEYEGVITEIAPAVNSDTKKTEVRIAVENANITNGDTVRVTKELNGVNNGTLIKVPLTAVKFDREDGFIFKIENEKLVKIPVKLGPVLGSSVEVISGLEQNDVFVVDARGLIEGEEVKVAN